MEQANLCSRRLPQRTFATLVLGALYCNPLLAYDGAHHWHDRVTISGSPPASVAAGQGYSFTPSSSDSAGRTLVFSISNKPSWATFSSSSGQLSGTPSSANVATYSNVTISVSDGWRSAALPAFAIQVLPTASSTSSLPPPTISGTPPTSDLAGRPYSFQPSASGPSGMQLAFSVQNKPSWATFSIATGLLSGTPGSTQTGTYSNIVVSVSDGAGSSALAPFSITVSPAAATSGTVTVNWVPPTQNTDGTALSNLAGLIIYYGTSPSNLTQTTQVAGATQTSSTISNLASGTWYFGGVAYTTSGVRSAMSSIISANIP